jgi:hypothetical protein
MIKKKMIYISKFRKHLIKKIRKNCSSYFEKRDIQSAKKRIKLLVKMLGYLLRSDKTSYDNPVW